MESCNYLKDSRFWTKKYVRFVKFAGICFLNRVFQYKIGFSVLEPRNDFSGGYKVFAV